MEIYKDIILHHWRNPRNFGSLENPDKVSFSSNPSCGDSVKMEAIIKGNKIKEIKFIGKGCIISTATASMLTEYAKGKSISHLKKLDKDFVLKMLKIELGPARIKCALLPLEVLHKLII